MVRVSLGIVPWLRAVGVRNRILSRRVPSRKAQRTLAPFFWPGVAAFGMTPVYVFGSGSASDWQRPLGPRALFPGLLRSHFFGRSGGPQAEGRKWRPQARRRGLV